MTFDRAPDFSRNLIVEHHGFASSSQVFLSPKSCPPFFYRCTFLILRVKGLFFFPMWRCGGSQFNYFFFKVLMVRIIEMDARRKRENTFIFHQVLFMPVSQRFLLMGLGQPFSTETHLAFLSFTSIFRPPSWPIALRTWLPPETRPGRALPTPGLNIHRHFLLLFPMLVPSLFLPL